MEWVLLAAGVGVVAFLLSRLAGKRPALDDECPLDRLQAHRRPAGPAKERAPAEAGPPPEDQIAPALRPSVHKLANSMPLVVAEGAKELGESGHADAVMPLIRALGHEQRAARFAVVEALLQLGPLSAAPLQSAFEKERGPEHREFLGRLLGQLDNKAKGLALAPTGDIVGLSSKLVDEVARGWSRN